MKTRIITWIQEKGKNMINWNEILADNTSRNVVRRFAVGHFSGKATSRRLTNGAKTEFNKVVRCRGVDYTRELARKALRRRNVLV